MPLLRLTVARLLSGRISKVMLVDCSRFLPGSRELAASYKLGGRSDACRTRDNQRQRTALSSLYSLGHGQDVYDIHDAYEDMDMVSHFPAMVMDSRTDLDPPASSG